MPQFDLGAVFNRFFKLLTENFGLFAIIGLVGNILPAMAISFGVLTLLGMDATLPNGSYNFNMFTGANAGYFFAAALAMIVMNLIALAMVTEVAILRAVGKPADFATVFGHALRNILPIIVISILVSLMVAGGFILLIIPGIFFALCTCIAVPSYIGEPGRGIFGSISRSFELTRGKRWWLLLIFFVAFLCLLVLSKLTGALALPMAMSGNDALMMPMRLLSSALDGITSLLTSIFMAAVYVCLRESKEKMTPDQTASVFS